MNLLRKLDSISRKIEKNMKTKQQVKTNVDDKRRDIADLRLLITTQLLIIKNNTEITELKYLLMIEKRIRQTQQEIFYSLLKIGQYNVEGLVGCIHKKAITRIQMPKVKDNLLFKTTRDLQNTRRVDVLKEEVRRDLDKITMKIIKDLQDVYSKKQVEEMKQVVNEKKLSEKDKLSGDNKAMAEEKNKMVGDNNAMADDKNAMAEEKAKLTEDNNVLIKEKDILAREKNAMAEEEAKLAENKNELLGEKHKSTEEKDKLTEDKKAMAEEKDKLTKEKHELYVKNEELQKEIKKEHEENKPELNANELSVNELSVNKLNVNDLDKRAPGTFEDTTDQDKKVLNLNKKQAAASSDKPKHKSTSKHKGNDRDTPVLLHHKKNNSDAGDESLTESFIFVLSKGSIETDKRFVELIKQTLKDIERYSDPVIVRMGIQFILAKRYVDDIIYLKEHASRKKFLIM